ncbi:hypothetical protein [Amycolatopsis sacchari]|uniref:Prolyl oligopeptidase family protein n=1 Tax=Amycolatopsis sacchari TaxID=115433 RepID=A0A1I4CZC8_9PSEU|nr:hypothetical protein [Amycolatopsis sacchari]SFK86688.1 hypothetical protein SAMN05421835_13940 [Amycolatopsis sacchari]
MSSVLDWVAANAARYGFDPGKILARGVSTGGYYAFRAAHTHAGRLFAVVAQGGGAHHLFDAEWISAQNRMECPFALVRGNPGHMGNPGAEEIIYDWLDDPVGGRR